MRILFPFLGDTIGGSHISDIEIIKALDLDKAYQPYVLLHKSGPLADYLSARDVSHIVQSDMFVPKSLKSLLLKFIQFIASMIKAKNYLKKNKIDVVYCSDGPLRYIWFYAAKLGSVKFVLTQQALSRSTFEKKISYHFLDGLVLCSQYLHDNLIAAPKRNIPVISIPIVTIADKNTTIDNHHQIEPKNGIFRVGFVANMRHVKRPYVFLDMVRSVTKHNQDMHFYMIGECYEGEQKKINAYIHDYNLENYVSLLGFQDNIQDIISQCNVIVATAVGEAFGRVPVEAGLLDVPTVASRYGGHIETIIDGETGYLVEPDNAQAFADKVLDLYNNPDQCKAMGVAAHNHMRKNFLPVEQIRKIKLLLDNV